MKNRLNKLIKETENGNIDAMYKLGKLYMNGYDCPKNLEKAFELLLEAAENGHAEAKRIVADSFIRDVLELGDRDKAIKYTKILAESGDLYAMNYLGCLYTELARDEEEENKASSLYITGNKWIKKAAEQGNDVAMYNMAYSYEHGEGVETSIDLAIEWYIKAAQNGVVSAMVELGNIYKNEKSNRDYDKAVEWYSKAAELGNVDVVAALGDIFSDKEIGRYDFNKAKLYYEKAIELGDVYSMNQLGYLYAIEADMQDDSDLQNELYEQSVKWYKKGSEAGNEVAMSNLAYAYERGIGETKSLEKAIEWYKKAAYAGDEDAKEWLKNNKEIAVF